MISSNDSTKQWGKLTSLNPDFQNISLSTSPANLAVFPLNLPKSKCQIYQMEEDFFISSTGSELCINPKGWKIAIRVETLGKNSAFQLENFLPFSM